ncbi:MAG: DNA topoisomerase III, partial [Eubacteriales bacterium]
KAIIPTSKGIQLVGLVPSELKSAELTAKWEQQLTEISKGRANKEKYLKEIRGYASKLVSAVSVSAKTFKHDNVTREKCPECGKALLQVKGKRGEMLVCQDRECGYRKSLSTVSNARCPQCHKKMEMRGDGENKVFACSCGYREKLTAFSKRREGEKSSINKRDASNYLNNQNNNISINTALADALAKLKK